jgi:hypothetical protein
MRSKVEAAGSFLSHATGKVGAISNLHFTPTSFTQAILGIEPVGHLLGYPAHPLVRAIFLICGG